MEPGSGPRATGSTEADTVARRTAVRGTNPFKADRVSAFLGIQLRAGGVAQRHLLETIRSAWSEHLGELSENEFLHTVDGLVERGIIERLGQATEDESLVRLTDNKGRSSLEKAFPSRVVLQRLIPRRPVAFKKLR
jgi:hypothetical protein